MTNNILHDVFLIAHPTFLNTTVVYIGEGFNKPEAYKKHTTINYEYWNSYQVDT